MPEAHLLQLQPLPDLLAALVEAMMVANVVDLLITTTSTALTNRETPCRTFNRNPAFLLNPAAVL